VKPFTHCQAKIEGESSLHLRTIGLASGEDLTGTWTGSDQGLRRNSGEWYPQRKVGRGGVGACNRQGTYEGKYRFYPPLQIRG